MKRLAIATIALLLSPSARVVAKTLNRMSFENVGADRQAIQVLLATYTRAVSTKDRRLFETLLLNQEIPFSSAGAATSAADRTDGSRNYPSFRKGVFEREAFTQRFKDIHIEQGGALANVTLVFINNRAGSEAWGWKTMQLLKIDGHWKIASEFYTSHK
jgi:hypothetical protein